MYTGAFFLCVVVSHMFTFLIAGAFLPGVPVQPVCLKYPNKLVSHYGSLPMQYIENFFSRKKMKITLERV